jgi:hypothetical protein
MPSYPVPETSVRSSKDNPSTKIVMADTHQCDMGLLELNLVFSG